MSAIVILSLLRYLDVLTNLLQGEKELELYLLDNPANEENVGKAKSELVNAEKSLRYVIQRAPKDRVSLTAFTFRLLDIILYCMVLVSL